MTFFDHRADAFGRLVADDEVAIALVAVGLGRAELRDSVVDDPLADRLARLADAAHPDDVALAHAPDEGATDRVFPMPRRVELVVDDGASPGAIAVDAVSDAGHERDVRAGRPLGDFADRERAVLLLEPLHMREAAVEAERLDRRDPHLRRGLVDRRAFFTRQDAGPLDPVVPSTTVGGTSDEVVRRPETTWRACR